MRTRLWSRGPHRPVFVQLQIPHQVVLKARAAGRTTGRHTGQAVAGVQRNQTVTAATTAITPITITRRTRVARIPKSPRLRMNSRTIDRPPR